MKFLKYLDGATFNYLIEKKKKETNNPNLVKLEKEAKYLGILYDIIMNRIDIDEDNDMKLYKSSFHYGYGALKGKYKVTVPYDELVSPYIKFNSISNNVILLAKFIVICDKLSESNHLSSKILDAANSEYVLDEYRFAFDHFIENNEIIQKAYESVGVYVTDFTVAIVYDPTTEGSGKNKKSKNVPKDVMFTFNFVMTKSPKKSVKISKEPDVKVIVSSK